MEIPPIQNMGPYGPVQVVIQQQPNPGPVPQPVPVQEPDFGEPEEPEPEEPEPEEPDFGEQEPDFGEPEKPKIQYIDDDVLSKNLNLYLNADRIPTFHVSFCIYHINMDCLVEGLEEKDDSVRFHDTEYLYNHFQPFLQFVLEKKESSYEFPSVSYECPRFSDNERDDDDKSQEQIHFETFCFNTFSTFLEYSDDMDLFHKEKIDIQGIFKGFVQQPDKEENITVVLDFTPIMHRLKPSYTLSILHEILYKKTVLSVPVNPAVTQFFESNPFMIPIKWVFENQEQEVLYPFQLYLCMFQDGEYTNVKTTDAMVHLPVEHALFGEIYAFTTEPIVAPAENETYRRFSCFLVKDKYLIKDVTEMTDEEKETEKETILAASTLYYHENGLQVWGIKNVCQFVEY